MGAFFGCSAAVVDGAMGTTDIAIILTPVSDNMGLYASGSEESLTPRTLSSVTTDEGLPTQVPPSPDGEIILFKPQPWE